MNAATLVMVSVLLPLKGWFVPDQPWNIVVTPPAGTTVGLVMTDFSGQSVDAKADLQREFAKEATVDIRQLFPAVTTPGAYLLYALPQGERDTTNFVGTPLILTVREDRRRGAPAGAMVARVEPLRYAAITTDAGEMTMAFYYDVAPNTTSNFIQLAQDNFYDGLTFHRIERDFVIQGGDPRGDGTGSPGYNIDAEFSDRKHEQGVVSMARNVDPNEAPNNPPRPEYANSAGSQFFICLDYKNTAQLDNTYTVFGRIVGEAGLKVLADLSALPIADKRAFRPVNPPVIRKVEIRPVTSKQNPYRALLVADKGAAPATQPAARP